MAGVYLHIPFCRKACTYCDFHFSTNLKRRDDMVTALGQELSMRAHYLPQESVLSSIYFGGGTPSVLHPDQIASLIQQIASVWALAENAEITLEANPDDLSPAVLAGLKSAGVNRLSIGVQSFLERDLVAMNRSHNAQQATQAVEGAQKAGFGNITLDLIYGLPGQDLDAWDDNLRQAIELGVPHISAYALTVEKKTALAKQVILGQTLIPPDETFGKHYLHLIDRLSEAGIHQYELSNFAKPGFEARHNAAYWKGLSYLGLGPSAHSFDGKSRTWNHANNAAYLNCIQANTLPAKATEVLSATDQLNEYIMTGLRKKEGIDLSHIQATWGVELLELEPETISDSIRQGWMQKKGAVLSLSAQGFLVSDHIISNLFQID
jgi:oxygen-independent coproporphyrinogen-3 oxidase